MLATIDVVCTTCGGFGLPVPVQLVLFFLSAAVMGFIAYGSRRKP